MKNLLLCIFGWLLPATLLAQGPSSLPVYQSGVYASDTLYRYFGTLGARGLGSINLLDGLNDTLVPGMRLVMVVDSLPNPGTFAWDSVGSPVVAHPGDTLPLPASFSVSIGNEVGFSVVHTGRPTVSGAPYFCSFIIVFTLGTDFGMGILPEFPYDTCYVDSLPYFPLLTEDKSWEVYQWENGGIVPQRRGQRQFLGADTVIQGQAWTWLRYQQIEANPGQPFVAPYTLGSDSLRNSLLMREDLATRQVWTYDLNEQAEFLTYDFFLQPGDTLFAPYVEDTLVLDSIRPVVLENGESRRQFFFSGRRPDLGERSWIEGIGGKDGLAYPFSPNFESGSWLECVRTAAAYLYSGPNLGCQLMVSKEVAVSPKSWSFYPQPASRELFLRDLPPQARQIKLYDWQGRLIRSYSLSPAQNRLELSSLPAGPYLLRLDDGSCRHLLVE
jgi:hypothetical protein